MKQRSRARRVLRVTGVAVISCALFLLVPQVAMAEAGDPLAGSEASDIVAPDASSSEDLPLATFDSEAVSPIPELVREVLPTLKAAQVDMQVWRDGKLILYATGNVNALEREAQAAMADVEVEVLRSAHPRQAIDAAIRKLVKHPKILNNNAYVAEAIPSEDGSRIDVGIAGDGAEAVVAKRIPDAVLHLDGIAVSASVVGDPIPTIRNRTTPPVVAGQVMTKPAGVGTIYCSTGFWIGKSTGERALISADHCGGTVGENWYYGGYTDPTRVIGTTQGQAAGGTDLELFMTSNPQLVSGYVAIGSHTNGNSVAPIRGRYSATIIGDSVCYSGSFSGLVCQNTVTSYASSVCYPNLQCYYNVTYTSQVNGIPAAGNGDSGGPVITVLPGGHAYATGIISGMPPTGASATCTGEPGGPGPNDRKCNSRVIFAPLEAYFNNTTGWGLMYIPQ